MTSIELGVSREESALSWRRVALLDVRSLAVGRIAVGFLIAADLLMRAQDLEAHYSDAGVLPRSAIHETAWDFLWSLHALSGSSVFEAALFFAALVLALAVAAGLFTRWAVVGSWLLASSLHARNPLLRDGQDDLLRALLYFSMFLPLGRVFSVDAWRKKRRGSTEPVAYEEVGIASSAFVLQLILIYWASGITKLQSPIWNGGGGVHYALSLSRYQTTLAQELLEHRELLGFLGRATQAAEILLPFLLLVPVWTGRLRLVVISAFVFMHLGFAACLHLGVFPFLSIAAWSMMLPPEVWERRPSASRRAPLFSRRTAVESSLAALGGVVVLFVNLVTIDPDFKLPRAVGVVAVALGLQQFWGVFAPNPVTALAMNDGWFVSAGTLEDGREVDAFSGSERLSYEKPRFVAEAVKNHRWRHYFANLRVTYPRESELADTIDKSRAAFLDFLCRRWNAEHPVRLAKVKLVYMSQRLGAQDAPVTPSTMLERSCSPASVAVLGAVR